MEARDVDAVTDVLDELVHRIGLSGCNGEGEGLRTEAAELSLQRVAGRGLALAGAHRSRAVPDDTAGDAFLDELHALLGRTLEVEALGQPAGVEGVVGDRDLRVEDALAEASGQEASLLEQAEPVQRVPREVLEQLPERTRLEHRAI